MKRIIVFVTAQKQLRIVVVGGSREDAERAVSDIRKNGLDVFYVPGDCIFELIRLDQ